MKILSLKSISSLAAFWSVTCASADPQKPVSPYGTITEETPSIPQYFSWINNTNEGSTEAHTLTNLEFFKWLYNDYGMNLEIYAWDAGNIDSVRYYGSMKTDKFKGQFPNGWGGINDVAKSFSCRLGLWGGPDGFGDTAESEKERKDLLVSLCRDYNFGLFKFDSVCTQLRTEKQGAFAETMTECRKHSPDLVVLNHRLNLGPAEPHATTFLWGGRETYIDVHMINGKSATHNRLAAISRDLPPKLQRLTEDHGVCISSCLDFWEDDLVLQGFNRNLILAPQIYGNPWLLRDNEFPKLSRIFNLHYRNRDILVKGIVLPEQYGNHAVARGDGSTRFLTLRNLSWEPKSFEVLLNEEIGLTEKGEVEVRRYHPSESVLGSFKYGEKAKVTVDPFRSCLVMVTTRSCDEVGVTGCDYEVVRDIDGKPTLIKLLGQPGTSAKVSLKSGKHTFSKAFLDGKEANGLLKGEATVEFTGQSVATPWHKHLVDLKPTDVPADAQQLYEATCFVAQNDALEVQSLRRSGETKLPHVKKARDAFFVQDLFWRRGIWNRYMFDDKPETFFSAFHNSPGGHKDKRLDGGSLRIDFKIVETASELLLTGPVEVKEGVEAPLELQAEVSTDLVKWEPITLKRGDSTGMVKVARVTGNGGGHRFLDYPAYAWKAQLKTPTSFRYVRFANAPAMVSEFTATHAKSKIDSADWHATHLFAPFQKAQPAAAWQGDFEIAKNTAAGSYLCVAVDGTHGADKAFAALRVDGKWVGAPQRAPSYPCVAWEYPVKSKPANNTFFFPVTEEMRGKKVEAVVLGLNGGETNLKPKAWITTNNAPATPVILKLKK